MAARPKLQGEAVFRAIPLCSFKLAADVKGRPVAPPQILGLRIGLEALPNAGAVTLARHGRPPRYPAAKLRIAYDDCLEFCPASLTGVFFCPLRRFVVTFDELRQLMADVFECPPSTITPDASPDTLAAWDSLRLLDLILAIEQQAGIEISPDRLQDMMSVPAILEIVNESKTA